MAARVKTRSSSATARIVAFVATLAVGCGAAGGSPAPRPPDPPLAGVDLATPQVSLSPQIAGTAAAVRAALADAGFRLVQIPSYRPSEPAEISGAPRAVFRVDLPDPDDGFVVVYEFLEPGIAAQRGRTFATYLGSPFGQTNYPLDAQFSLSQVGGTLVFTWWSAARSSARDQARAAFDAVGRVGLPIPVLK